MSVTSLNLIVVVLMLIRQHCHVTGSLLQFTINTNFYDLFNVLLHHARRLLQIKAFDSKDKIPFYLTTNIQEYT